MNGKRVFDAILNVDNIFQRNLDNWRSFKRSSWKHNIWNILWPFISSSLDVICFLSFQLRANNFNSWYFRFIIGLRWSGGKKWFHQWAQTSEPLSPVWLSLIIRYYVSNGGDEDENKQQKDVFSAATVPIYECVRFRPKKGYWGWKICVQCSCTQYKRTISCPLGVYISSSKFYNALFVCMCVRVFKSVRTDLFTF